MGLDFPQIVQAADAFKSVFGKEVREPEQGSLAAAVREEPARAEDDMQAAALTLVGARLPGGEMLDTALAEIRAIHRGPDQAAVLAFNASWKSIKDAIRRAGGLGGALTPTALQDLANARRILGDYWSFLKSEPDLDDTVREKANALADLLAGELFFREIPAIEQHARAVGEEYRRRYQLAVQARRDAYAAALEELAAVPGWIEIGNAEREKLAAPLRRCADREPDPPVPIPQLRSDLDACPGRLEAARTAVIRLLEGERVVTVQARAFFSGGVDSEEQLDAALVGLREECARFIGAGKKVVVQ